MWCCYSFDYSYYTQFQEERLAAAAMLLVPLKKCIQSTIEYTRERKAFDQSILDNQYVHYRLAEMETEIECLRALTYRATGMYVMQFYHPVSVMEMIPVCGIHRLNHRLCQCDYKSVSYCMF